jgi:hypothetical protein
LTSKLSKLLGTKFFPIIYYFSLSNQIPWRYRLLTPP